MSKLIQFSKDQKSIKKETSHQSPIEDKSNYRIIAKNLVYIIGLSESMADKNILMKYEYLGQYGKILKIIINKKKAYNQGSKFGPTYSAYITYNDPSEASIAILSIDKIMIDNHLIRANFGTTKYCQYYLNKNKCPNKNCVFLHKKANPEDIINREDLNCNPGYFFNQQIYAIKLADIYNPVVKEKLLSKKNKDDDTIFPSPYLIYQNDIVIENTPKIKKIHKLSISKEKKNNENENVINIHRVPINSMKLSELETSNSTITTSNCLTSSLSSKSIEIPNNVINNNNNNNTINNNNNNNNNNQMNNTNLTNYNSSYFFSPKKNSFEINNNNNNNLYENKASLLNSVDTVQNFLNIKNKINNNNNNFNNNDFNTINNNISKLNITNSIEEDLLSNCNLSLTTAQIFKKEMNYNNNNNSNNNIIINDNNSLNFNRQQSNASNISNNINLQNFSHYGRMGSDIPTTSNFNQNNDDSSITTNLILNNNNNL